MCSWKPTLSVISYLSYTATVTMARTGRKHSVCLLTESFFQMITEEQRRLLTSGSSDDVTQILLAEMILDIVSSVTETLLTAPGNIQIHLRLRRTFCPVRTTYFL